MIRTSFEKQKGVTIAVGLLIATVTLMLLLAMGRTIHSTSKNFVYLTGLNQASLTAQTATNMLGAKLAVDALSNANVPFIGSLEDGGTYNCMPVVRDFESVQNGYYIVCNATKTTGGKRYVTRMHTYIRISNMGEYFAAVNDNLGISFPVVAPNGKVYSNGILTLATDVLWGSPPPTAPATTLLSAEYVGGINYVNPQSGFIDTSKVIIGTTSKLSAPILFPQVLDSDIDFYRTKAGPHKMCTFSKDSYGGDPVHIYPPGYQGNEWWDKDHYNSSLGNFKWDFPDNAPLGNFAGVGHSTVNAHHVYFCDGDMRVEGVIHGQVLFVATGNIFITSSVVMSDFNPLGDPDLDGILGSFDYSSGENDPFELIDLYGGATPGYSTANQAVFITRKDVVVSSTFVTGLPPTAATRYTQTIQGMIFAPHGSFYPMRYNPISIHDNLQLRFDGSMVLGNMNVTVGFSDVFIANRNYAYLDSLNVNPPPYLPAIIDVMHVNEEILEAGER